MEREHRESMTMFPKVREFILIYYVYVDIRPKKWWEIDYYITVL